MSGSHHEPVLVQDEAHYRNARKVTLDGAVVNIVLSVIKTLVGLLSSSHALIADGIHPLSEYDFRSCYRAAVPLTRQDRQQWVGGLNQWDGLLLP